MNNRVKSGLFFGMAMTVFFIVEKLLTQNNLTTPGILKLVTGALAYGAISGFLFGWLIGKFTISKFVSKTTKIEIDPEEKMIFQTGANHFKGMEAIGGKLYLTDKRMIFKSHRFNIQNHELIIKLTEIKEIDRFQPLGLTDNGLSIQTSEQRKEEFVVEKVEEWLLYLKQTGEKILVV